MEAAALPQEAARNFLSYQLFLETVLTYRLAASHFKPSVGARLAHWREGARIAVGPTGGPTGASLGPSEVASDSFLTVGLIVVYKHQKFSRGALKEPAKVLDGVGAGHVPRRVRNP